MTNEPENTVPSNQGPASTDERKPAPHRKGRTLLCFLAIPILLAIFALVTIFARRSSNLSLAATTQTLATQNVNVIHAEFGSQVTDLTVPGTVQAFSESPIYARINGYLRAWNAYIGAHVGKGQLLAAIEAPDIDQELSHS